jgi:nickel/cobalt transporter (NiCoT) family protein
MINLISALFGDRRALRADHCINVGAWVGAFATFHRYALLLGTSLLAWSFGLRHAVDADHMPPLTT